MVGGGGDADAGGSEASGEATGTSGAFDESAAAGMAAGSISTTRSNIKSSGSMVGGGGTSDATPTKAGGQTLAAPAKDAASGDEAGIAIKENGIKVDGGAGGIVADSDPIPGADVKLGKNPGGALASVGPPKSGPGKPTPTRPDPPPDRDGPGGGTSPGAATSDGDSGETEDQSGSGEGEPDLSGATIVNTTRSNIKNAGSMVGGGGGADSGGGEAAEPPAAGTSGSGDDFGAGGMAADVVNTTRSNIKNGGSVVSGGGGTSDATPTKAGGETLAAPAKDAAGGDEAGIAIKEQGVKVDGGGGELAADGDPVPGLDVKLGKNPGGALMESGPVKPTPTRPDPPPDHDGRAGASSSAAGAGDTAGETGIAEGVGQPIPGVDIVIKKNPPR
jgi:hypothetical protein